MALGDERIQVLASVHGTSTAFCIGEYFQFCPFTTSYKASHPPCLLRCRSHCCHVTDVTFALHGFGSGEAHRMFVPDVTQLRSGTCVLTSPVKDTLPHHVSPLNLSSPKPTTALPQE
jgi:hypothetical protein